MKDRILNVLMLFTVALALILSLVKGEKEQTAPLTPALQALAPVSTLAPDPVTDYRRQRESQRQQEMEALRALCDNEGIEEALRKLAAEQLMEITSQGEMELALEGALAAKGYQGVCVLRKGKLTIFVSGPLDGADAALIAQLAMEAAGVSEENIRIAAC